MLTYDQCVQLRDAGFPQPEYQAGQMWYVKNGGNEDDLGLVFPAVLLPDNGSTNLFVATSIHNHTHRLYINPFSLISLAYCPTVEDMLSLLLPGWILTKTKGGNWVVADAATLTPLYLEKTPMAALMEAWIDRRYLFEDTAGSKMG